MNKYIILLLIIIWIIVFVAYCIIFSSDRIYCFVYEHKDWKLWNKICKHLQEAKLIKYNEDYNGAAFYFEFRLIINSIDYDIIYWCKDSIVSVHHNKQCILSSFDKYHSNKAAEIIRQYLL